MIADNFLQFWFPFVQPGLSYLESGHGELVLDRLKKSFIDRHVAYVYEDVCRAELWDLSAQGVVPVFLKKVGRWWDARDGEIDIVGLSEVDNAIVPPWRRRANRFRREEPSREMGRPRSPGVFRALQHKRIQ